VGRPATLSRARIEAAAAEIIEAEGVETLSARRLGSALGCDPSALYRHFADMDDLRRAVGDRMLAGVRTAVRAGEPWDRTVRRICLDLRRTLLTHRRLAGLVQGAPTRLPNEMRITEALLAALLRSGLEPAAAAGAYHALIELTIGSAAIDADVAAQGTRAAAGTYRTWRNDYRRLEPQQFPALTAVADHLYRGSAADRFERALDALLASLAPLAP
jgi:AcrR family transcriptional regulator